VKALVYTAPREMTLLEQPEPDAAGGEAVVEIEAVGICGSDMHAYQGHDPRRVPPLILGHEICGRVRNGAFAGRRVILNPLITCGHCDYCRTGRFNICANRTMIGMTRPGGYAERVAIPEQCLVPVAEDMDPVHAALTEPAATGLHGLVLVNRVAARPVAESRALVIGAGSVGLLTALLLRHFGCERIEIAERNALRREPATAEHIGRVYDPVEEHTTENAFDLVVDCVGGAKTRELAMHAVAPGGVFLHVGLMDNAGGLDARKITLAEITVLGAYTYITADLAAAAAKLASGAYGALEWVETRPLVQGATTFAELLEGRIAAPKVVLLPAG
jgi:threonine dehydrogenase-like Zn-dependent dehydrogenase